MHALVNQVGLPLRQAKLGKGVVELNYFQKNAKKNFFP
jgi:hypothetical protein